MTGPRTRTLLVRGLAAVRGPVALMAVLGLLAGAFLVTGPRVVDRSADAALGDLLAGAPAAAREVGVTSPPSRPLGPPATADPPREGPVAPFEAVDAVLRDVLGPEVSGLLGMPTWAAQSEPAALLRPGGTPLRPDTTRAVLRAQSGLDAHVRWVDGGAPGPANDTGTTRAGGTRHPVRVVPVALAAATARAWGVAVGDVVDAVPEGTADPVRVVVTGTFTPLDPGDGFWAAEPRMAGLAAIPDPLGGVTEEAALVADVASYGALSDALWRAGPGVPRDAGSPVLAASWRYPVDAGRVRTRDVGSVRALVTRLDTDPRLRSVPGRTLTTTTGLGGLVDEHATALAATAVMTGFATTGLTALTVLVLALTALVALARREAETALLRARGGSLRRLLVTGAVGPVLPVVLAAAAGAVAAAIALPGTTGRTALVQVSVVALVPALAGALALVVGVRARERRDPGSHAARRVRVVRVLRRAVGEAGVVVLAVLAVTTVRSRGAEIASGRQDWFAALVPVLVAAAAALVVLRVLPPLARRAAGVAARRRGLVAFLGLARSARGGARGALPVVTVVVGAAVLTLLAQLTLTLDTERETAALRTVGAEGRVDALRLDPEDVEALLARPGVGSVLPAYVEAAEVVLAGESTPVVLVATDVAAYGALVEGTALAVPDAPAEGQDGPVPVLGGPGLAPGTADLVVRGQRVPIRVVSRDSDLVRVVDGRSAPAVLVDLDALQDPVPAVRADTAFLDSAGARALLGAAEDPAELTPSGRVSGVVSADAVRADVAGLALPRLVTGTYLVGAVLAAALTLVALLLLLVASRAERAAAVARLRTMGLPRGRDRALAWVEVLPVVALGGLAGAAVGLLGPTLVAPALDLAPFTGSLTRPPLDPSPLVALGVAAGITALGGLALVLDAAAARRGPLADHLRRGDTA
ncbi:hypothetical protein KC207_06230 [Phycicoccus sp. BSK3Z-2]|uniref:ABC3 transporter permease C-terminal domain-containing protein n=1 Tax=Phycicoccus avicenniae TaxID=2828860 RepID=A0A941DAK7_9MICO|nr:FtsX-like permease family protein [Phycicoccus avicenniae]MBR7742887.1 hypothetical protein [Phycicoccus avicenniae]